LAGGAHVASAYEDLSPGLQAKDFGHSVGQRAVADLDGDLGLETGVFEVAVEAALIAALHAGSSGTDR
jgi:hypothetical protein